MKICLIIFKDLFNDKTDPRVKYRVFPMDDHHANEQNIMGLKIEG
jgi:hypothetical protein